MNESKKVIEYYPDIGDEPGCFPAKLYYDWMTPIHPILDLQSNKKLFLGTKEGAGYFWNSEKGSEDINELTRDHLLTLGIKAIVCCRDLKPAFPEDFEYLIVNMDNDEPEEADISEKMKKAYEFILKKGSEGSVLVHCKNGWTRSPSVVTYFVMRSMGVGFDEAVEIVRRKRSCIDVEIFRGRLEALCEHDRDF